MQNEKDKYFTPDIEDIRVGYECETYAIFFNVDMDIQRQEWIKLRLIPNSVKSVISGDILINRVRVPYLTKEQIEAEGWEYKQTNKIRYWYEKESPEIGGNWYGYYIYKAKLIHDPEMNYLKILFSFDAIEDECVFEGKCKDINTFRYICKLLNI